MKGTVSGSARDLKLGDTGGPTLASDTDGLVGGGALISDTVGE